MRDLLELSDTPSWSMLPFLLLKVTLLLALAWLVHFSLARASARWRVLFVAWRRSGVMWGCRAVARQ